LQAQTVVKQTKMRDSEPVMASQIFTQCKKN